MYGLRNSELSTCLFQFSHKMHQTMLLYSYFTPKVDFKRKFKPPPIVSLRMMIDSADDLKISNRTINTNRISNRTYDSKSNRITKLRRSLVCMTVIWFQSRRVSLKTVSRLTNVSFGLVLDKVLKVSVSSQSQTNTSPSQAVSSCWSRRFMQLLWRSVVSGCPILIHLP